MPTYPAVAGRGPDLYAALGVRRTATQADLRRAYLWIRDTERDPARLRQALDAYAVLADPRQRQIYDQRAAPPARRRARRLRRRETVVAMVTAVVVALGVHAGALHRSLAASGLTTDAWVGGQVADVAPPFEPSGGHRLLPAPPAPVGAGPFAFERTGPGDRPVSFDPCRPVHFVVAGAAVPGGDQALASAVEEVSRDTGLLFVDDGSTGESPSGTRPAYQPDRYGPRWAPVLVAWTDVAHVPGLAGNVVGLGGQSWARTPRGALRAVSGIVYLDGPDLRGMLTRTGGATMVRDVILHELGHLVGLAHVDDPMQVMYRATTGPIAHYSDGDRRGLARVAAGGCLGS